MTSSRETQKAMPLMVNNTEEAKLGYRSTHANVHHFTIMIRLSCAMGGGVNHCILPAHIE